MKIGFIGDVVGKPGREIIRAKLKQIKSKYSLDLIIANTENASHGFGLTCKNANELFSYGIDFMTGGNHTWDKKEIFSILDVLPILRPLNLPEGTPGKGIGQIQVNNEKLYIVNLMGHFAMPMCDNAFNLIDKQVKHMQDGAIFIDFHAEATSEKMALFALLENKVSAIIGTHTHVGTDDLQVRGGTAYLSDVGLTGCRDGVIGMEKDQALKRLMQNLPASLEIPKQCKSILQMALLEIKDKKCVKAQKLRVIDDKELLQEAIYD